MRCCPECAGSRVDHKRPATYRYRESGLDHVVLHGGVEQFICRNCRATYVAIENEPQLLQVIAFMLLVKPGHLTGPEMRYLRKAVELSQSALAHRLGIRRRETIAEREQKKRVELDLASEFHLRAILLKAFTELLSREDNNHLGREHRRLLVNFTHSLLDFVERIRTRTQNNGFELRQIDESWESELLAG